MRMSSLLRRLQLLACLAIPLGSARPQSASPVGFWQTVNDRDGRAEALVEIREIQGEYVGTVRALLVPADRDDSICTKCSDDRRGQRIVGMEILRHMRRGSDGAFGGGEILDPENGKIYRASMRLVDGGRQLIVRGFIGFSIFGRSETWVRRPDP